MKTKIRIKDIARQAGVSPGTVDRVLHNRGEVRPETRGRIEELIRKSGYTPNLFAKSLATRKTYRLAVVIPNGGNDNPYWDMPLSGISKAADEIRDYNAIIELYPFDLERIESFSGQLSRAFMGKPEGLVLAPVFREESTRFIQQLEAAGIPYVFLDSRIDDTHAIASFGQDTFKSGYLAARLMCYGIRSGSTVLILKMARPDGIIHHLARREKGFRSYINPCLHHENIRMVSLEIDPASREEPRLSLDQAFQKYPDIAGIFVTNSRASLVAGYLEKRRKRGLILIGYDVTEANARYLKKGTIDFLLSQKPEDQGYQSIMALYRYLLLRQEPEKVNFSPIDIITRENIQYYR